MMNTFGKLLKELRLKKKITLREFCKLNGIDHGNYSRMERGLLQPPQKVGALEKYALALGLKRDSEEWREYFDSAAASRGEIPSDLLADENVAGKLPVLFRTLRGDAVTRAKLDKLLDMVRRS